MSTGLESFKALNNEALKRFGDTKHVAIALGLLWLFRSSEMVFFLFAFLYFGFSLYHLKRVWGTKHDSEFEEWDVLKLSVIQSLCIIAVVLVVLTFVTKLLV